MGITGPGGWEEGIPDGHLFSDGFPRAPGVFKDSEEGSPGLQIVELLCGDMAGEEGSGCTFSSLSPLTSIQ